MKRSNVIFLLFTLFFFRCAERESVYVGIQPIGKFESALLDTISNTITKTYSVQVFILPEIKMPREAFVNIKTPRYRADKIISIVKNIKPDSLKYILCLTDHDISTSKTDW